MSKKQITYTANDRLIYGVLQNHPEGLTLAEINEAAGTNLVSGHIVALMNKGIIEASSTKDVIVPAKRKVFTYSFVTLEPTTRADGKLYSYTDSEKSILEAASTMENPFTLEQLGSALGRKISSGSTNGLIRKGNLVKGDQVEVMGTATNKVKVYTLNPAFNGFDAEQSLGSLKPNPFKMNLKSQLEANQATQSLVSLR